MTFKKGDQVRTEDGAIGQILFIDKNGVEAQVALERISIKLRTDTLCKFEAEVAPKPVASPVRAGARAAKGTRATRAPKK
ncbi:MAG: hypothetical protein H0T51_01930 [Pirellulales bacterium]|nr:hypothetical protein [Pirellulales bacterium]